MRKTIIDIMSYCRHIYLILKKQCHGKKTSFLHYVLLQAYLSLFAEYLDFGKFSKKLMNTSSMDNIFITKDTGYKCWYSIIISFVLNLALFSNYQESSFMAN